MPFMNSLHYYLATFLLIRIHPLGHNSALSFIFLCIACDIQLYSLIPFALHARDVSHFTADFSIFSSQIIAVQFTTLDVKASCFGQNTQILIHTINLLFPLHTQCQSYKNPWAELNMAVE